MLVTFFLGRRDLNMNRVATQICDSIGCHWCHQSSVPFAPSSSKNKWKYAVWPETFSHTVSTTFHTNSPKLASFPCERMYSTYQKKATLLHTGQILVDCLSVVLLILGVLLLLCGRLLLKYNHKNTQQFYKAAQQMSKQHHPNNTTFPEMYQLLGLSISMPHLLTGKHKVSMRMPIQTLLCMPNN